MQSWFACILPVVTLQSQTFLLRFLWWCNKVNDNLRFENWYACVALLLYHHIYCSFKSCSFNPANSEVFWEKLGRGHRLALSNSLNSEPKSAGAVSHGNKDVFAASLFDKESTGFWTCKMQRQRGQTGLLASWASRCWLTSGCASFASSSMRSNRPRSSAMRTTSCEAHGFISLPPLILAGLAWRSIVV